MCIFTTDDPTTSVTGDVVTVEASAAKGEGVVAAIIRRSTYHGSENVLWLYDGGRCILLW